MGREMRDEKGEWEDVHQEMADILVGPVGEMTCYRAVDG